MNASEPDIKAVIAAATWEDVEIEWSYGRPCGGSADEYGEDPYYDTITIAVLDEDGEPIAEVTFEDATIGLIEEHLVKSDAGDDALSVILGAGGGGMSDNAERAAERRQMGLINF